MERPAPVTAPTPSLRAAIALVTLEMERLARRGEGFEIVIRAKGADVRVEVRETHRFTESGR